MGSSRRKKGGVTINGPWLGVSLNFLRSTAFAKLSPLGVRMLFELIAQIKPHGIGNGNLSAARSTLRARGWVSNKSIADALRELEEAKLIVVTRRGGRNRCALYAVTLYPLACDTSKLEVGPGSYTTFDWEAGGDKPPTSEAPVTWKRGQPKGTTGPLSGPMQNDVLGLPSGPIDPRLAHSVGQGIEAPSPIGLPSGPVEAKSRDRLAHPVGTSLDCHLQQPSPDHLPDLRALIDVYPGGVPKSHLGHATKLWNEHKPDAETIARLMAEAPHARERAGGRAPAFCTWLRLMLPERQAA